MKKTLIALATLAAAGTAFAQSTATISGSISVGVMDTGAANAPASVASLGGGANAIDIVTREDLGGGMNAGFTSQIRFSGATGDMGSTAGGATALFHAANVYVGGGFGTVRAGKIAEASTCGLDPWGCTGGAGLQGGVGVSAIGGAAAIANAISYTTPTINGFSASYQSSLSTRTNERQTLNLSYANGPLTLQVLDIKSSATNTAFPAVTATTGVIAASQAVTAFGDDSTQRSIGASYNFGVARLSIVNTVSKNNSNALAALTNAGAVANVGNPVLDRDVMSVGLTVPMGAYTFLAGYNKDSKAAANADTKIAAGVNYALSKRTTIGADVFKAEGQLAYGAAPVGTASTSSAAGVLTPFSNVGTGFVIRARHTF